MKTLVTILMISMIFISWTQEKDKSQKGGLDFAVYTDSCVQLNKLVYENKIEICIGEGIVLKGRGADKYYWSNEVIDGLKFYPEVSLDYCLIGKYENGETDSIIARVIVHEAPIVDFKITDMSLNCVDPKTGFENLSSNAERYLWSFGDGSSNSNEFEPIHSFPINKSGEYKIILSATSSFGCKGQKIKYLRVFEDYSIYVPKVFVLNENIPNKLFKPILTGFKKRDYSMCIYNSMGEIVFETNDMDVGWDGSLGIEKNTYISENYTWKIQAVIDNSDDTKLFVGHVLIRNY